MRHSFLPNLEQEKLNREYHIRLLIVTFLFLSTVGLIGAASLFPTFIQINIESREQQEKINALKKDNNKSGAVALAKELKIHQIKMSAIGSNNNGQAYSLIQNVISHRNLIRINHIAIETMSTSSASLRLDGIAPTRESLIAFKALLEKLEPGTKVDLPISGLAKNKDIQFSIKITQPII